jgi:hypothetical protein
MGKGLTRVNAAVQEVPFKLNVAKEEMMDD